MKTFEAVTDRVCTEIYIKFSENVKESEEIMIILVDLYDTVRPVLTCGSGTWILSTEETKALGIFERKTIRKIYGLS
jgi:hypothetical protein